MIEINDKYFSVCLCTLSEETQRRAQALEDMQRHLEEEHALQMSLLLAEQEKEQHRLCLVSTWNCTIYSKYTAERSYKFVHVQDTQRGQRLHYFLLEIYCVLCVGT